MRSPNYKVGWLVPNKLAALTHFHSDITPEDIMGVFTESKKLLQDSKEPFQIIIDNRFAPLDRIYSLEELQNSSPLLLHPLLNHLVIIKPYHLKLERNDGSLEERGGVYLKNVSSVDEAIDFVVQRITGFNKREIDIHFFDKP